MHLKNLVNSAVIQEQTNHFKVKLNIKTDNSIINIMVYNNCISVKKAYKSVDTTNKQ